MNFLISWLILTLAVWLAAVILPGVRIRSFWSAVLVAAVFGVLNFFLGWLMFVVIGIGTLGLGFLLAFITRWIIDAVLLKLTSKITDKFTVDNFGWALGAAALMALIGTAGQWVWSVVST